VNNDSTTYDVSYNYYIKIRTNISLALS